MAAAKREIAGGILFHVVMARVPKGAPLAERGSRLVGVMDLAAGHYPGFLFGLPVTTALVPVFHFHESTRESLEPALRYLAENRYETIGTAELTSWLHRGVHPGPRRVMLCFDDALASLWLVVAPLLARYGLRAVTYAIPARVAEAAHTRPTIDHGPVDAAAADAAPNPFATWPELAALAKGNVVEIQSHTATHAMVFADATPVGLVTPDYAREHFMNRPQVGPDGSTEFLTPDRIGFPIFGCRSRMSDGRRYHPDLAACTELEAYVRAQGGVAFLADPGATASLAPRLSRIGGRTESDADRERAIEQELATGRDLLESRLGITVRHVCLPWGITGHVTRRALERLRFETAFANRLSGRLAVRRHDDPFFLKRLHSRHIFALPGQGRRVFTTLA